MNENKKEIQEAREKHALWQKSMYEKYPVIFRDNTKPMNQTCMCWGISVDMGWSKLIEELCEGLQRVMAEHDVKVIADQVKEKFGTLRFYYHIEGDNEVSKEESECYDKIRNLVSEAEDKSERTCEECGEEGKLGGRGWLRTTCERHKKV